MGGPLIDFSYATSYRLSSVNSNTIGLHDVTDDDDDRRNTSIGLSATTVG